MQRTDSLIVPGLLDAIGEFPAHRELEHCGLQFRVSSLDIYGVCPECGVTIKLRSFSACDEFEVCSTQ